MIKDPILNPREITVDRHYSGQPVRKICLVRGPYVGYEGLYLFLADCHFIEIFDKIWTPYPETGTVRLHQIKTGDFIDIEEFTNPESHWLLLANDEV
jgi:hypothetical protein